MEKQYEINMSEGPLLGKIIRFSIPVILAGLLQLLFNAADTVVVGRFAGSDSLAAVGSTGALINLIVNLFIGFSIGANVLVARYYGSLDNKNLRETVHTSMLIGAIGGLAVGMIGFLIAPPLLNWMGTPPEILPKSVLYVRIYFGGLVCTGVYDFGSAILSSVGDTRRPLYFLLIAGAVNVVLNLVFVIFFHMDVAGVALATVISNAVAAGLVLYTLMRTRAAYSLSFKELRLYGDKAVELAKIGIPAGLNGTVFALSNVVIQSSINSFGAAVMAGNTAAANIEGFGNIMLYAFNQASLSATSQNIGAKKPERIGKIVRACTVCVTVIGAFVSAAFIILRVPLISIYSSDPQVIAVGVKRLMWVGVPQILCGYMDMMIGTLRGMGYSALPMVVSMIGACGFRTAWVYTVFAKFPTFDVLLASYMASWVLTTAALIVCYLCVKKRVIDKCRADRLYD